MKNNVLKIIIGIVAFISIAGIVFWLVLNNQPIEEGLQVKIFLPKNSYQIGEAFSGGKYILKYSGKSFDGIVVYREIKDGEAQHIFLAIPGKITTGDIDTNLSQFKRVMFAFNITGRGVDSGKLSFSSSGKYTYEIAVYSCKDISVTNKCSSANLTEINFTNKKPIKFDSQTVIVGDTAESSSENISEIFQGQNSSTSTATSSTSTSSVSTVPVPKTPTPNNPQNNKTYSSFECGRDSVCLDGFVNDFLKNLETCKISKGDFGILPEVEMGAYRGYEILGLKNNSCQVRYLLIQSPSVQLENKDMICTYANEKRNISAVQMLENCKGALYDAIISYLTNQLR